MTDATIIFDNDEPNNPDPGTIWIDPAIETVAVRVPDIVGNKWLDLTPPDTLLPSKSMRVVQQVLHRMNFTMGNNSFTVGDSTSGGVLTTVGSLPSGFDKEYEPSVTDGPFEYYGATPTIDGFGLRFYTATAEGSPGTMLTSAKAQFGLWGDAFVIELERPYASYRILVEENGVDRPLPIADLPFETTGTGSVLYKVEFPTTARRVITIEISGAANTRYSGRLGSLYVKSATSSAFRVERDSLKLAAIGDSSFCGVAGRGGTTNAHVLAEHMGIKDVKVNGVAGTGFITSLSDTLTIGERRSDVLDFAPDIAIYRLSAGDWNHDVTDIVQAVLLEVTTLRAAHPDCVIFILDHIEYVSEGGPRATINTKIRQAVTALHDPFVNVLEQGSEPFTYWLEQGTGNSGDPQGDGPRDVMVNETEHWSELGDLMMGSHLAKVMKKALEDIYFGFDKKSTKLNAAPKIDTLLLMNGSGLVDETGRHTVTNYEGTVTQDGMVRFDGSSSLVVSDNLDDFVIDGPYTIEMQINADALDATTNWVWLSTLNDAVNNGGWEVFTYGTAGGHKIAFYGDGGEFQAASPAVITGSSVDIAIVNDFTQLRIYVDGIVYIAASATTQPAEQALRIGRETGTAGKNPIGGLRLKITKAALYSGGSYTVPSWPRTA